MLCFRDYTTLLWKRVQPGRAQPPTCPLGPAHRLQTPAGTAPPTWLGQTPLGPGASRWSKRQIRFAELLSRKRSRDAHPIPTSSLPPEVQPGGTGTWGQAANEHVGSRSMAPCGDRFSTAPAGTPPRSLAASQACSPWSVHSSLSCSSPCFWL